MTNEMGNQNTSGIKEEEKAAVEVPEGAQVADFEDEATEEGNNITSEDQTEGSNENAEDLPSPDIPSARDSRAEIQESDEKEPVGGAIELGVAVSGSIEQLSKDWFLLNLLVQSIGEPSDADELMQQDGEFLSCRRLMICPKKLSILLATTYPEVSFARLERFLGFQITVLLLDCYDISLLVAPGNCWSPQQGRKDTGVVGKYLKLCSQRYSKYATDWIVDILCICCHFKFLRILDLECINMKTSFPVWTNAYLPVETRDFGGEWIPGGSLQVLFTMVQLLTQDWRPAKPYNSGAFEGPNWEMNKDEFKELRFLKWVLQNCKDLEEMPLEFAYIATLETIEGQWCRDSVQESAKRIGNETKEIKEDYTVLSLILPDIDKFKKIVLLIPRLLHKVKGITEKLKKVSSQFPVSYFPKACTQGFIDFLGKNIKELLKYDPKSIEPVKNHLKEVQLHLKTSKSFLMKVSDSNVEQGELSHFCDRIRDVAYKLEYIVESFELDGCWQNSLWLYFLLEDLRLVNQQVSKFPGEFFPGKSQNLSQISREMESKDSMYVVNEMVVNLSDEEEVIIERLTRGSLQRHVVSIVGMPGIGKTTFAKRVYNHQIIVHYFHRRAWCNVSLAYSKRQLLLEILSGIHGLTDDIHRMCNEDLQEKLRRCLMKYKYLRVMDDVWDIAAWHDLENSFPNDSNGSRILITSRLQDVAAKIKPDSDPYSISLLSDEESWILLEKKVFRGKPCPEELLLAGKEIAQHCKGLPLAVVAIAGLLQKTEKRQEWWKTLLKSLSSVIIKDPENRWMEILELSYNHLPEYLKSCFLYFGHFS
ncbi:OLC1v1019917C1 [Oldenlandia corymbosa var. corymbosa]|uniref:OLC1v1019917C1 n=1 Tax=Oldenlandia corymbosa var. corymbosa TaxID=529605 RepID=A0AAV1EFK7_OLDCO|nr:OLC1v1019917C1 [Oldenlandia corymbosa var. corymbosa]